MNKHLDATKFTRSDFIAIEKARAIIRENLRWHFTIPEIARKLCINERKLKIGFKKSHGMGLYEYRRKTRLIRAKELLEQRDFTMEEIAHQVGYKSISSFSLAFKKKYGEPPSQWLRKTG